MMMMNQNLKTMYLWKQVGDNSIYTSQMVPEYLYKMTLNMSEAGGLRDT